MRGFSLAGLTSEPWRNGGGVTRTVASGGGTDSGGFGWRVSVADITCNGPFSIFPSVDRQLALIEGASIVLRGDGHSMRLERIGEVVSFRGEEALEASLVNGPVRAWNLMVARGVLDGRIRLYEGSPPVPAQLNAHVSIICVLAGRYTLHAPGRDGIVLRAGDGVCLHERVDGARLSADSADDRVLITDIFSR